MANAGSMFNPPRPLQAPALPVAPTPQSLNSAVDPNYEVTVNLGGGLSYFSGRD